MTKKHPIRSVEIWDKMVEFDRVGIEDSIIYRPSDNATAILEAVLARRMGVEGIRARKLTVYLRDCWFVQPQPTAEPVPKTYSRDGYVFCATCGTALGADEEE